MQELRWLVRGTERVLQFRVKRDVTVWAGMPSQEQIRAMANYQWSEWMDVPEVQAEQRKLIGYTERDEGFYPLFEAAKGSVVTHAFIMCKYCNGAISPNMGPRYDAVCLTCFEKEPDERTN